LSWAEVEVVTRSLDAERLELGGGLEILLQATLTGMRAGELLDVVLVSRATALELPGWARLNGHTVVGEAHHRSGYTLTLRLGAGRRVLAEEPTCELAPPPLRRGGEFHTAAMRGTEALPEAVARDRGFTPIGAVAEHGAPPFDWRLHRRDTIWAPAVADLAEQASAEQWDGSRDIPWQTARDLPEHLQRAVAQVMTFIAQNEYAALYVPATFLPQIHPAYPEVVMWLASHVNDEARHIEVFTKRALLTGHHGYALASTELSLHSLLAEHDFTNASLLLNVLGEGTFLDLLRFVERHAPDPATAAAARLAHRDERRHVHFGIAHVRHVLTSDPEHRATLIGSAEQRAAKLTELSLSPLLTEGLTIMAAGSLNPASLSEGAGAVRDLMSTMERNRIRRLRSAGFKETDAQRLSDLHTPNLM
jgi:TusA-related sulfurtransferase